MSRTTKEVLECHYKAFRKGVDVIIEDYAEDAVLMAPDGMHKGHAAIKKYEDGDIYPSSDMLIKLARALKVRVDFFFRQRKFLMVSFNGNPAPNEVRSRPEVEPSGLGGCHFK